MGGNPGGVGAPAAVRVEPAGQYQSNAGANAAKRAVLARLQQGWLTQNDLCSLCCLPKSVARRMFDELGAVPLAKTGLDLRLQPPAMSKATYVRRSDLEELLDDEGWRVCRNQQDDPAVIHALMGNELYPLLNRLLSWAREEPRRKIPLLDLALELHLTPSDVSFDLNREIDWADQAGLMRDDLPRTDLLAVPTRQVSRPGDVSYSELITLEDWTAGKPFQIATTRVLARERRLEHQHAVLDTDGTAVVRLVPRWAEILSQPEDLKVLKDFQSLTARLKSGDLSATMLELAIELGVLKAFSWGRGRFVESRRLGAEEAALLNQESQRRLKAAKIQKSIEHGRIHFYQADDLARRFDALLAGKNQEEIVRFSADTLDSMRRMVGMACLKAAGSSLDECGQQFDLSRERVRQILNKYERYVLMAQSIENKVRESVIEALDGRVPAYRHRLKSAADENEYALLNQIWLETYVLGYPMAALYTSYLIPPEQSDAMPPLEESLHGFLSGLQPEKSSRGFHLDSPDKGYSYDVNPRQAEDLCNALDRLAETPDGKEVGQIRLNSVKRGCEIALLIAQGYSQRHCARLHGLTPNDVLQLHRKHLMKLANVSLAIPQITAILNQLKDAPELPPQLARVMQSFLTGSEHTLLNALFLDSEVLHKHPAELLALADSVLALRHEA